MPELYDYDRVASLVLASNLRRFNFFLLASQVYVEGIALTRPRKSELLRQLFELLAFGTNALQDFDFEKGGGMAAVRCDSVSVDYSGSEVVRLCREGC